MQEQQTIIEKIFSDEIYRCIISDPVSANTECEKIMIRLQEKDYQVEKLKKNQVFHERVSHQIIVPYIKTMLETSFRQLHAWSDTHEYSMRISKKGNPLFTCRAISSPAPKKLLDHNREKKYILSQSDVIEPLVDMGVMTPEGNVISSMYNKYRQINRFLEIVDDEVKKISTDHPLSIVDLCCGKSYLTFVLYHYLTRIKGLHVKMLGLDLKESVIDKCNETARKYGYDELSFQVQDVNTYEYIGELDMVVALHACDTATDYVLFNAVRWKAGSIFSVPCCQHELHEQIENNSSILTRYGIIKERVAALMTDAIRANLLECCGYQTQLLEFVDLEHTPKNILIRAVRTNRRGNQKALAQVEDLMEQFHLSPTLYRLFKNASWV